jgi:hypothetical protein
VKRGFRVMVPVLCLLFCNPAETAASTAETDSLDIVEQILAGGYADESEAAAIATELRRSAGADGFSGSGSPPRFRLERTVGYRETFRLDGSGRWAGVSGNIGMRSDRGRFGGCVRLGIRGKGLVVRAGGLRPRLGENLLLGAGYSPFRSVRRGRDPGLAVTPTSSVWNRTTGALISLERHGSRVSTATWRDGKGRESGWLSVCRRSGRLTAGGAAGGTRRDRLSSPVFAGGSLFVASTFRRAGLSAEVAVADRRVYAAMRFAVESEGLWQVELYKSPRPSTGAEGVVLPGYGDNYRCGGVMQRTGALRGLETRVSLCSVAQRTPDESLSQKRLDMSVGGGTGDGGRWNAALRLSDDLQLEYPPDTIEHKPVESRDREAVLRTGWSGGGFSVFRQRYRLSVKVERGGGLGVVSVIGWNVVYGGLDAGFQATNYSMSFGQTGFVLRPGFSGGDAVTAVTQSGSDLSARIRLNLNRLCMRFSWSRPWRAENRWYITVGFAT